MRFCIYTRIVDIERKEDGWQVMAVGSDGKRRPAGFVIPDFVEEHELVQYLEDLFHESASPTNSDLRRIDETKAPLGLAQGASAKPSPNGKNADRDGPPGVF